MGQIVLHASDKNEIGVALNDGAHVANRAGNADLGVAAQSRRGGDRR
jgi:hypothetical protein